MRRTFSALAVAAIAVALAVVPSPAHAALPNPVDEIPDIPSRTVKMTPTWSEAKAATIWRAMMTYTPTDVATIPKLSPVPKPITAAAPIARGAALGGVAAGSVLVGFQGGWALGQGGLSFYAAATDQTYQGLVCSSPGWYQAANEFLMLGVAPDCGGTYTALDEGTVISNGSLTYQGFTAAYVGRFTAVASGALRTNFCWGRTGTLPAGSVVRFVYPPGSTMQPSSNGTACFAQFGGTIDSHVKESVTGDHSTVPKMQIRSSTSGPVVAETGFPTVKEAPDVVRTPNCTITWDDGTTTTGAGDSYTQREPLPASAPGFGCKNAWDAKPGGGIDTLPTRIKVDEQDESGGSRTISDNEVPPMTETERKGLTVGNGRGLVLSKIVADVPRSCMTWEVDCSGWWEQTSSGTQPQQYRCTYAGEGIPLTECGPYRNTFDTQTNSPTITDPATGQPVPWSSTAPGPITGPLPGSSAGQTTGGGACSAGWSWNPVDWVLNPIKCAFIPSEASVATATAKIENGWSSTAPAKIATFVAGVAIVAPGSGCGGIPIDIPWFGHDLGSFNLLEACPGTPLHPVAIGCSWLIGIAFGLGALYAVTRAFGFITGARGIGEGA